MASVIGIDPGLTGAIARLSLTGHILDLHDMPVQSKPSGGSEVDCANLAALIERHRPQAVCLEQVGAMPKQGVSSTFSFGDSFGVVRGVCGALQIRTFRVRPPEWKKHFKLTGKDKDYARTLCLEQFPEWADELRLKKHQGRADAVLLALWYLDNCRVR